MCTLSKNDKYKRISKLIWKREVPDFFGGAGKTFAPLGCCATSVYLLPTFWDSSSDPPSRIMFKQESFLLGQPMPCSTLEG
jgi:hypothetical protein